MKKALLLLLLSGLLSPATSFAMQIDTVFVRQSSQGGNNMEVITHIIAHYQPSFRINYTSAFINDILFISACYYEGPASMMGHVRDTLQVGFIPPGNYTLHYKAILSSDQNQCIQVYTDIMTATFVVSEFLGVKPNPKNPELTFHPNPVKNILQISGNAVTQLNLYDLRGKLIKRYDFSAQNSTEISVADLPKGLYFADLISRDGVISRKRLVKN
ncbi:T9SS type A sorting domain-containing protein [Adhaeribacter sp. BT258]|uniref:T9SS type A sorting domain-containing protein n=1 Tax=Adhaeribacter terrigena TaxID=2793070 RepID=A0ABS1C561_9BACT|nr:T9SS type A sorting domain-containing protein [Adhaeribacter terrigena]MBK0404505.1 T9SS type A sorting domain-containing protein [Adhaeribacter terrigena]